MSGKVKVLLKQATNSIRMDFKFYSASSWSAKKKIKYYFEKYRIKFKHSRKPFYLGKDYALLGDQKLYYDSVYGLSGHQSVVLDDLQLIKKANLKAIKTVVDVGANVGFFSLGIAEMFPRSTVHSLEPIPDIYKSLVKNTENKKQIHTYNFAISDHPGTAVMAFNPNDTVFSKIVTSKNGISVPVQTLDDFVKKNHIMSIDLLTIDTETFESFVLRGGSYALSITRYLMIEVTVLNNKNYSLTSLLSLLSGEKYDYQLVEYKEHPRTKDNKITYLDLILENKSRSLPKT